MYSLRRQGAPESVMELCPVLKEIKSLKKKKKTDAKWNEGSSDLRTRAHLDKPLTCGKGLKESLSSEGNQQQQEADVGRGQVPSQQAAELRSFDHMVLALESRIQERGCGLFPHN